MPSAWLHSLVALSVLVAILATIVPSVAEAQVARQLKPRRAKALSLGGLWIGPTSLGSATASLTRPDGSDLVVFRAEHDLGSGLGVETSLAFEIGAPLWAEVTGTWTRSPLRTRVSDDVESAPSGTLTESVSRFAVEGSALYYFPARGRTAWFARGGAGWMRELTGNGSLAVDGVVANVGAGLRHWWRESPRGGLRKLGVRVEFRMNLRSTGLSPVAPSRRIAPAAAGSLVIGF